MVYDFSNIDPNNEKDIKELAEDRMKYSNCKSRKVGCVIVLDGCIVGLGSNQPPLGMECEVSCRKKLGGVCYAIHAEVDAIVDAANKGIEDLSGAILYTSNVIPCVDCQKMLFLHDIREVVCAKLEFYDGADLFWKMGAINFREYKL
jgi:deoxycytidylate deaminase